ncbi:hypothetical protein V6N11_054292 [Hibiscus sabdariffa]|uniref:Uncharacterized protein n=1 Tax=Hibiscus sabdariffa TaxID=183260 RepID=A0ABR2S3M3_9ROSI
MSPKVWREVHRLIRSRQLLLDILSKEQINKHCLLVPLEVRFWIMLMKPSPRRLLRLMHRVMPVTVRNKNMSQKMSLPRKVSTCRRT